MSSKKGYNLFLDDVRKPSDVTWVNLPMKTYTVVRSYKEFRDLIWNQGIPKFVTYDHDLSSEHYENYHKVNQQGGLEIDYDKFDDKTGYDCAKFLVNECNKLGVKHPPYEVHSMNPVGKQNIISYVESYNRICKG